MSVIAQGMGHIGGFMRTSPSDRITCSSSSTTASHLSVHVQRLAPVAAGSQPCHRDELAGCVPTFRARSDHSCRASRSQRRTSCRAAEQAVALDDDDLEEDALTDGGPELSDEFMEAIAPATVPTAVLSAEDVWDIVDETVHENAAKHYRSFYSSVLGGIVTDPGLMQIAVDDHLVHRGHAVFDTAKLVDGHLYQLPQHFNRLLHSAGKSAIPLPMSERQLVRIILETAAASNLANGHVRFWLSAGRGGFGLSPMECLQTTFYVMVYSDQGKPVDISQGWKVKTSPVPAKAPYFATLKSTNYLVNALCVLDAEVEGCDQGIFLDPEGNVAEGPNMNLGIVTNEGMIVLKLPTLIVNVVQTPPFDYALGGITMTRMIELIPRFVEEGLLRDVTGVEQRPISVEEAKAAAEVFLTSSSLPVKGVVSWDGEPIGEGVVGPVTATLRVMMERDATPDDKIGHHTPVPYGFSTGMLHEQPAQDVLAEDPDDDEPESAESAATDSPEAFE